MGSCTKASEAAGLGEGVFLLAYKIHERHERHERIGNEDIDDGFITDKPAFKRHQSDRFKCGMLKPTSPPLSDRLPFDITIDDSPIFIILCSQR